MNFPLIILGNTCGHYRDIIKHAELFDRFWFFLIKAAFNQHDLNYGILNFHQDSWSPPVQIPSDSSLLPIEQDFVQIGEYSIKSFVPVS